MFIRNVSKKLVLNSAAYVLLVAVSVRERTFQEERYIFVIFEHNLKLNNIVTFKNCQKFWNYLPQGHKIGDQDRDEFCRSL
jgi:hypothetical protein